MSVAVIVGIRGLRQSPVGPVVQQRPVFSSAHFGVEFGPQTGTPYTMLREPLLDGTAPSAFTYLEGLGIIAVTAGLASLFMARLQKRLIFHL